MHTHTRTHTHLCLEFQIFLCLPLKALSTYILEIPSQPATSDSPHQKLPSHCVIGLLKPQGGVCMDVCVYGCVCVWMCVCMDVCAGL